MTVTATTAILSAWFAGGCIVGVIKTWSRRLFASLDGRG